MAAAPNRSGEFTGRHLLFITVGFFSVVVAVNIGMAVVSSTSWTGLVVDNSYVASQEFETRRLAHETQASLGWQSAFEHADGLAALRVTDANGRAVELGGVTLLVNRPVGGHEDQKLTLTRAADGRYVAPLNLATGVWDAHIEAPETEQGPYELHERFAVEAVAP